MKFFNGNEITIFVKLKAAFCPVTGKYTEDAHPLEVVAPLRAEFCNKDFIPFDLPNYLNSAYLAHEELVGAIKGAQITYHYPVAYSQSVADRRSLATALGITEFDIDILPARAKPAINVFKNY